jgi:hypothetical protein
VLLKTHKRLMTGFSGLKLVNVNNHINGIFRYSGFDKLFDIKTLRSLASLLPPAAEGGFTRRHQIMRSTLLVPFASLTQPTRVGGSPAAPQT